MRHLLFSWSRLFAVIRKEFIQMRRDRLTFAMMVLIPLMQLTLFGYAINTNPKNLPSAVLAEDNSPYTRAFIQGLKNTEYFKISHEVNSEQEAKHLIDVGEVLFVFSIPSDFTYRLLRHEHPSILVEADATDPVTTGNALAAVQILARSVLDQTIKGSGYYLKNPPPAYNVIIHAKFNPESNTQYNIVPALLGVVLTMTMVVITSLAITRERERGTMENLLAMPVRPLEVMVGKITPYILVGYIQVCLILLVANLLFKVPIEGSLLLLLFAVLPFIAANLAMGLTFSSIAQNQLQAMQMAFFFFLPSILLSGFMFPFKGMPQWAQYVGEILPLTHFLRIVRGILLKGTGLTDIWREIWPIGVFMLVAMTIGLLRYKKTLD
ncbi:MAG TPA: ABC transporter permease [Gammaproteobacteria bacterium]|nr:ABC transporter permease [Gammaproteobacteria bacterium]